MVDESRPRIRYGEAFWRAHHEAWCRSDLKQREYCEAQGIPLKAFQPASKFKAEPQQPLRKLLYRRSGLSHSLSHTLSHSLGHMITKCANAATMLSFTKCARYLIVQRFNKIRQDISVIGLRKNLNRHTGHQLDGSQPRQFIGTN